MFYQRFIHLCESTGVKPSHVAKQLGLASGSPTAWKNGTVPDREALVKIADYFDCSVDYLLGRDPKDAPAFSPKQRKVLELYESLSPEQQENFERLLDSVLGLKKQ